MNKKKLPLFVLLLAVFIVSTGLLLRQQADKRQSDRSVQDALALAAAPPEATASATQAPATAVTEPVPVWAPEPVTDDPVMAELAALDIAALQAVNPDVLGWIRIPGTKVDYPLLQGADNDYYLKHTWKGEKNASGSIFLEWQNSPDLTDFNTIIYGHNMNNGSMFASLRQYAYEKHWNKHPYIYIATAEEVLRYEVFSSYQADVEGEAYLLVFPQDSHRQDFLDQTLQLAKFDTGIRPEITDRILTLSTCSGAGYSTRWVVHARLKMTAQ